MSPKDAMKTKYFRKTGRVGGGGGEVSWAKDC